MVYRNSESVTKFEVMIRLPDVYQMSEMYLSVAAFFLSFKGMSSPK